MNSAIGQELRAAREARGVTLEQVSHATLMRVRYLQALEDGNFEAVPSRAQARGFLRAYAVHLGLDPAPLLAAFDGKAAAGPAPVEGQKVEPAGGARVSSPEAEAIFADLGSRLVHQRELLGLSLDDVVRHTHLRRHYLQALEAGKLAELPSPVQGRGMLNNYAAFLGMDPEPLLLRFADGLQARLAARQAERLVTRQDGAPAANGQPAAPARPKKKGGPSRLRRVLSSDLLIGMLIGVLLVGFVTWGAVRIFALRAEAAPEVTAPSIADILLASATPSPTATLAAQTQAAAVPPGLIGEEDTATPEDGAETGGAGDGGAGETTAEGEAAGEGDETGTIETGVEEGEVTAEGEETGSEASTGEEGAAAERIDQVQVTLTVHQRAWVRVSVDGEIELQGRVLPGSAYNFTGESKVEVLTGNGAALQIFYNQQDLGLMGVFGQIVDRVYTLDGPLGPTPTPSPTPTETPRANATPAATEGPGRPAGTPGATQPALP